jgi:hypothetical protein
MAAGVAPRQKKDVAWNRLETMSEGGPTMLESRHSRFLLNEAAAVITGGRPLRFLLTAGVIRFPPAKHNYFSRR